MRIAIITAMWKRHAIFRAFSEGVKHLQSECSEHEFSVFICGSEGDVSRDLATSYGFSYCEVSNEVLSKKLNAACLIAKEWNPDYCLMLGSDDIVAPSMMRQYSVHMDQGIDYIYTLDCYFYDVISKRGIYWAGYRKSANRGHACGAGRALSKRMMDGMGWTPWLPAETNLRLDKLLDTAMDIQMDGMEITRGIVNLRESGAYMLDIKSAVNMTPFERWDNTEYMEPFELMKIHLGEELTNQIRTIVR